MPGDLGRVRTAPELICRNPYISYLPSHFSIAEGGIYVKVRLPLEGDHVRIQYHLHVPPCCSNSSVAHPCGIYKGAVCL